MKVDDQTLDRILRDLARPAVDAELAERVQKIAAAELEPRSAARSTASAISGVLVPAMISSAAVVCTVDTVKLVEKVFAGEEQG